MGVLLFAMIGNVLTPIAYAESNQKFCKALRGGEVVVKTVKMVITAYSSTPDQTDDTPFITASGDLVGDGIVAINGLPFDTRVRIDGKIYVVKDRMHARKGTRHADIWMSSRKAAQEFGWIITEVEILEG